ncbi:MAG: aminotransferase class I/II-fold pyridoxal phosphate-dependent enzyme [Bacteroidetes bacterium]|nr:aminotransferase class I/II-fold pyridoxal phosphate-dependent enzyme [Bacteroidota bacterium]
MLRSKLPDTGTTIFSVMSALAAEHNSVNLSQGFPDFPVDPVLTELVYKASKEGHNQYAPMAGVNSLRDGISELVNKIYGVRKDPEKEITITSGATEALFAAVSAVVDRGDEVILFDPSYDSYEPAVLLSGGIPVRIPLTFPEYGLDREKIISSINSKTRLIILNSPNNPTGAVLSGDDFKFIRKVILENDLYLLSDEVYEHIIFDGMKHYSVLSDDELFRRSFVVSSFGKTFHITGWKVGYCIAPEELTTEFRKIHQFLTFSTSTPFQYALSEYIRESKRVPDLKGFYEKRRDYFRVLVESLGAGRENGFKLFPCGGTYFQLLDYSALSDENDLVFAKRLTVEFGIASIPVSVFYKNNTDNKVLRFCFAKEYSTLDKAAECLGNFLRNS